MKTRKASQRQTRHQLEKSDEAKALINELVPVGADAELTELIGWRDRLGNLRRARAIWANGWSAEMFFTLPRNGQTGLSSYRINWHGTIKGAAA